MTSHIRRTFVFTLLVLGSHVTGFAAQQTHTMSFGPTTPNFTAGPFDFTQFDPALGTLNFVEFKLQLDTDGGSLIVDNDGELGGTLSGVSIGAEGSISSSAVNLLDGSFNPIAGSVVAATSNDFVLEPNNGDNANDFDASSPDGGTLTGIFQSTSASGMLNTNFWDQVTGTSTYPIEVEVDQVNNFGSGVGGVEGAFTAVTASGNVTVTYDYQPVPEPASDVMFIAALFGIAFAIRRS